MCHRQSQSLQKWRGRVLHCWFSGTEEWLVVSLAAAAPVLLRFLSGGSRIQLAPRPSQVTLGVRCQAGWTAGTAACLAPVVHGKVEMVAQALFQQL